MVEVLVCPCAAVKDEGLAESEKSGGGWTVTLTPVVCVPLEPVPLTVTVVVPVGVLAAAVTVSVVVLSEPLDGGVTELLFRLHVAFNGHAVTVSPTALLNPLRELTLMVEPPLAPP
jgi:hypothetical protein